MSKVLCSGCGKRVARDQSHTCVGWNGELEETILDKGDGMMIEVDKDKLVSGKAYKIYFRDCCIEGALKVRAIFQYYMLPENYIGHGEPAEYYKSFPQHLHHEAYNYDLVFDIGEFSTHNALYFEEME